LNYIEINEVKKNISSNNKENKYNYSPAEQLLKEPFSNNKYYTPLTDK
jgi:hypothetical protein